MKGMQRQMDEGRSKLATLEAELRGYEQERNELLQECNDEDDGQEMGMDDDEEEQEGEAEAKRKRDKAEQDWQEVKSRRLLRAQAKRQASPQATRLRPVPTHCIPCAGERHRRPMWHLWPHC